MELAEYHRVFSHKTRSHILAEYKNRGMDETKILQDVVFYCLPTAFMILPNNISDIEFIPGFHPDVTPDMFAAFMYRNTGSRFDNPLMIKSLEYDEIYEAVRLLLDKGEYWCIESGGLLIIYNAQGGGMASSHGVFMLDADKFIFLMDAFARNNYATVLKNNIFVDYFGTPGSHSIADAYVDEFKQMCIESTKTY